MEIFLQLRIRRCAYCSLLVYGLNELGRVNSFRCGGFRHASHQEHFSHSLEAFSVILLCHTSHDTALQTSLQLKNKFLPSQKIKTIYSAMKDIIIATWHQTHHFALRAGPLWLCLESKNPTSSLNSTALSPQIYIHGNLKTLTNWSKHRIGQFTGWIQNFKLFPADSPSNASSNSADPNLKSALLICYKRNLAAK